MFVPDASLSSYVSCADALGFALPRSGYFLVPLVFLDLIGRPHLVAEYVSVYAALRGAF